MIKNYFKIAFRNFKRHKLFTLINIIGLSIGISASLVIYLIVSHDLSFDKFHKDGDRIYRVVTNFVFSGEPGYNGGVTGPLPEAVKNEVTGLQASAPFFELGDLNVNVPSEKSGKFKHQGGNIFADQRYFSIIQYKWLAGSAKASLNAPFQLVLTSAQAKKYFPSLSYDQMIGKQVVYEDTIKTTVTGIVQEFKDNTDFTFHDFISFSSIKRLKDINQQLTDWGGTTSASLFIVKLAPGTKVANIEKQMNALQLKYNPPKAENKGNKEDFALQPLSDIHFNEKYYAMDNPVANKTMLYGLMVIGLFLLILGCINFINLTTAQASQRAKEIGIRKTMGSSRGQLLGQFLSETFLVTLLAVVISIVMAPLALKLFSDFISKDIKFDPLGHPGLIIFIILLTIVVSFISGFYPALVLSSYKPVLVLKNQAYNGTSKTRNAMFRKSLTVTQLVIAQFFIMATILVSKQIYYVLHKDMGFKKDAIVYINLPWKQKSASLKQVLLDKIKALPQVEMVSLGGDVPSSGGWNSRDVTYRDGKKEVKTELYTKSGDDNYTKIYKIKLIAGRFVGIKDTNKYLIINATYAHILGFKNVQDAVGKSISFGSKQSIEIAGVFGDFHQNSLRAPIKPLAIMAEGADNSGTIHIALKPETPNGNEWKAATNGVERAWKEVYPQDDFEYHFFDEQIAKFYESEQHTSKLLTWATGLSILISCLGLLGLTMYTTNLRTKEIGVRKVLGASVTQIVTLLSTELVWLVVLAFVIVTPLAWWAMNKLFLQNFADRTSLSWWIFALSGAGMLLTALLTLSFQTIKAAIANPVKSLRSE